jgi:hypothetical protein
MIEESLRAKILADTDVTDDIGQRLYILKLPQSPTLPAVTYFKVSNPRHHDIDVAMPRYQFDIWAESYITARGVADNIRKALQRESGTWTGIRVIQAVYLGETDMYEDDTELYHVAQDYKIIYRGE